MSCPDCVPVGHGSTVCKGACYREAIKQAYGPYSKQPEQTTDDDWLNIKEKAK